MSEEIISTSAVKKPSALVKEKSSYDDIDQRSNSIFRRIKTRLSAIPKTLIDKSIEEKEGIEKQLEKSDQALAELFRDGTELATNIQIANDKREVDRRKEEAELREELLEKLQKESIAASAKFADISARWSQLDGLRDPMGIYEGLEFQKTRIDDLLHQKDAVIEECRKELDLADIRYYSDQEKQSLDVQCLVERVDNQINIMKRAYREHLELLQNSIDYERDVMWTNAIQKWEDLYVHRAANEEMKMAKEKEKTEFYANEIERIALEHEELTRATRIRLEKDNQDLLIELENLKGNVLLNSDKLDYNFQVLKRREDENAIIRNQQKRRVGRLNETVMNLKHKINELQKDSDTETTKLTEEIMKWQRKILYLEEKADTMLEINEQKYQNIWKMHQEEGIELLDKILAIDKLLYEQQLGLEWEPPQVNLINKEQLESFKKATETISKAYSADDKNMNIRKVKNEKFQLNLIDFRILRTILRNIADRSGFLIEQKLIDLLQPYAENNDQVLVRIDNVFNALGIRNINDVASLKNYFESYAFCQKCSTKYTETTSDKLFIPSDLEKKATFKDELNSQRECKMHSFVIDPASVLTALREYVEKYLSIGDAKDSKVTSHLGKTGTSVSRLLDPNEVKIYWERFQQVFSPQKQNLWYAVEQALQQHIKVLKKREKLTKECEELKKQNNELKFLMKRYMPTQNQNLPD